MQLRDRVARTFISGYVGAIFGGVIAGPIGAAIGLSVGGAGANLPMAQLLIDIYQAFRSSEGIFGPKGSTHKEVLEQHDKNLSIQDTVPGVVISSSYNKIASNLPAPPSGANTPRSSSTEKVETEDDKTALEIALQDPDMQEFEDDVFTPVRSNTP